MRIIIDGYNVLKNVFDELMVSESRRQQFIYQLQNYAKKKGHQIVLVFDGGQFPFPDKSVYKDVAVVYAGSGRSADDYIAHNLMPGRGEQLLVSSDRQLCQLVGEYDVASIDAQIFYGIMKDALASHADRTVTSPLQKQTTNEDQDLDRLMEEASLAVFVKKEDREYVEERPTKMSKLEKKLYSLLKKL